MRAPGGRSSGLAGWQNCRMAGRKCASRSQREILESGEFADEGELDDAGRAVALLGDDELGDTLRFGGRLAPVAVHVLAVDEHDDVGALIEGARFAQVRELRTMIRA